MLQSYIACLCLTSSAAATAWIVMECTRHVTGTAFLAAEGNPQPTQAALQRTTAVNRAPGVRSSQGPGLAARAATDATVSVAEAARRRIAAAWSFVSFHFFTFLRSL